MESHSLECNLPGRAKLLKLDRIVAATSATSQYYRHGVSSYHLEIKASIGYTCLLPSDSAARIFLTYCVVRTRSGGEYVSPGFIFLCHRSLHFSFRWHQTWQVLTDLEDTLEFRSMTRVAGASYSIETKIASHLRHGKPQELGSQFWSSILAHF